MCETCHCITCELERLTDRLTAYRLIRLLEKDELTLDKPLAKPRNLFRLAGVINAANTEADNEAGELIDRVRRNKARTLGLIAKGHRNETLREQMLSEAEKEQELANLEAAVGDNGGPLLEDPNEDEEKVLADLKAAKSAHISKSSGEAVDRPLATEGTEDAESQSNDAAPVSGSPEVGQTPTPFRP